MSTTGRWIAGAVALAAVIAVLSMLPLKDWIDALQSWVEDHGTAGVVVFALAYVAATLLFVPTWVFTVIAGAVFGMAWGFALVVCTALTSATLAFLLARYVLRERAERIFARHKVLKAVDKAVRKEGWKVVALMRLSPLVPFGVQNYFFGVTSIKASHFVAATAFGIMPGTLVYLFLGATGRAALGEGGAAKWALLGAGLAATVIASLIVGRAAKKRLGIKPG
jgi:uncharacterized membrane protein YdjX (TVP38/TMEM64 family)